MNRDEYLVLAGLYRTLLDKMEDVNKVAATDNDDIHTEWIELFRLIGQRLMDTDFIDLCRPQ